MKTLSIFGCGWVGKAFLEAYHKDFIIKASVQSQESLEQLAHKNSYLLNADNHFKSEDFFDTDVLIIAIPPRNNYLETIKQVLSYTNKETSIILHNQLQ